MPTLRNRGSDVPCSEMFATICCLPATSQIDMRFPPISLFIMNSFWIAHLCDELDDATGLLDLALSLLREEAGTDDDWDLGDAALAEDLGVAQRKEVEDGSSVGLLARDVGLAGLLGDQGPELVAPARKIILRSV